MSADSINVWRPGEHVLNLDPDDHSLPRWLRGAPVYVSATEAAGVYRVSVLTVGDAEQLRDDGIPIPEKLAEV